MHLSPTPLAPTIDPDSSGARTLRVQPGEVQ